MLHQQSGKDGHKVLAPKAAPKAAESSGAKGGANKTEKPRLRMLHRNSGKAGFKDSRPPPPQQQQQVQEPASDPVVFVEKKKD